MAARRKARTKTAGPLKVLIVDDHHLVREGLKVTIGNIDAKAVIHEAETIKQAIERYKQGKDFDLVLLDLHLSSGDEGIGSLETFYAACADAHVVVISASHDMATVQKALKRGVAGFIPKMSSGSSMFNALTFILNGEVYVPPEVFLLSQNAPEPAPAPLTAPPPELLAQVVAQPVRVNLEARAPATPVSSAPIESPLAANLTVRQMEVLRLLLEGKSNKDICNEMKLAMGTVKSHVAAVLHALGAATRSQAVATVDGLGWRPQILAARAVH